LSGASITCSTVSGTFNGFRASDHPIVWHVRVGNGSFQSAATVESPSSFVGSGSASANISAMTDQLHGTSATVQAFATWASGQSATTSALLTCGVAVSPATASPTTTSPPQVSAGAVTAPTSASVSPLASAAAPVSGAPRFTG
jgi:hypothetical protein